MRGEIQFRGILGRFSSRRCETFREVLSMVDSPNTRPSLLVRLRDPRNGPAWEEFLEIYTPLLQQLARRKGLQESDAADLMQDVFRAVAQAIDRYDPDPAQGSFRAWLSRIARNLIVNQLIARRRHPPGAGGDTAAMLLEGHPAPAEEETAIYVAEYRRRLFSWAAEQVRPEFSEPTWRSFWMAGVEGGAAKDVAAALGLTVGAVYHNKSRVMARLRQRIEQAEGASQDEITT
jgi:RNA polymerase sigma factor (sigma-70 family)